MASRGLAAVPGAGSDIDLVYHQIETSSKPHADKAKCVAASPCRIPGCRKSLALPQTLRFQFPPDEFRDHPRRLTNCYSKKFENHVAAVSLWVCFYNLCRVHETLRCTPAMALGVTDHV